MKVIYQKRGLAFLVIFLVYLIAFAIGFMVYTNLKAQSDELLFANMLLYTFIANTVATIIVFGFSVVFKNSSVYDPYWSVTPIAIVLLWFFELGAVLSTAVIFVFIAVFVWGIRLTYNWAINFKGMHHQDWRYTYYKNKNPKIWPITNFFGIHYMPTLIVYLSLISAAIAMEFQGDYISVPIMALGMTISVVAASIQFIADKQMREFRLNPENKGKNIEEGLWKYSRHPNYFGEIMMWWGLFILQLGVVPYYISVIGPIAMTLLFLFISIPLMENHVVAKRPNYIDYQKRVSPLALWFQRKPIKEEEYERTN